MHSKALSKPNYRAEIDGLRAFAVIAVIINHFNGDLLPSGYLGVDIFFVISGYVITSSLNGRKSKDFRGFITSFYERRIKRLFPALIAFVLITSVLICFFDPKPSGDIFTGISSLFGISNIAFFWKSKDYFSSSVQFNPFTHTWSLSVEEQFYLFFPFLTWVSGFSRKTNQGERNLFLSVLFLTIISLISFIFYYKTNQPAAYFLMTSRFWEISTGCLLFLTLQKKEAISNTLSQTPASIVFLGIIGVLFTPIKFAAASTVIIVLLSSILIACLREGTTIFNLLTNKKVVYIGLISYSLYLWHWGILALSRWTIGINFITIPFQIIIIIILAILSYEFIEKRFRRITWSNKRLVSYLKGLISPLLLATLSLSMLNTFSQKIYLGERSHNTPLNPIRNSNFYIYGDSHAYDIFKLLEANNSYKAINLTTPGCHFYIDTNSDYQKCVVNAHKKERLIKEAKEGDVVILASNYFPTIMGFDNEIDRRLYKRMINYLEEVLPILEDRGVTTIFKLPHPHVNNPEQFVGNGLICKKEIFRPYINQGCLVKGKSKKDFLDSRKVIDKLIREFTSKYSNVVFWDISEISCPSEECYPVTNENQYTVDNHHLFITSPKLSDSLLKSLNFILLSIKEN